MGRDKKSGQIVVRQKQSYVIRYVIQLLFRVNTKRRGRETDGPIRGPSQAMKINAPNTFLGKNGQTRPILSFNYDCPPVCDTFAPKRDDENPGYFCVRTPVYCT